MKINLDWGVKKHQRCWIVSLKQQKTVEFSNFFKLNFLSVRDDSSRAMYFQIEGLIEFNMSVSLREWPWLNASWMQVLCDYCGLFHKHCMTSSLGDNKSFSRRFYSIWPVLELCLSSPGNDLLYTSSSLANAVKPEDSKTIGRSNKCLKYAFCHM